MAGLDLLTLNGRQPTVGKMLTLGSAFQVSEATSAFVFALRTFHIKPLAKLGFFLQQLFLEVQIYRGRFHPTTM